MIKTEILVSWCSQLSGDERKQNKQNKTFQSMMLSVDKHRSYGDAGKGEFQLSCKIRAKLYFRYHRPSSLPHLLQGGVQEKASHRRCEIKAAPWGCGVSAAL